VINRKRTQRLWREEGLKRPPRSRKKRRLGQGRNQRMTAATPDHMWASNFQTDTTVDGRQVRFLNIIDEYTREALATRAFRSCTSDQLCAVLDDIIATTGRTPTHLRMDNGTEMTAHAMADWCRFTGVDASFIDPASPWQNGTCESFNGRFRGEFLTCEQFGSMLEVQVLAEDWRIEYNTYRPHGSLDFLTSSLPHFLTSSPPRHSISTGSPKRARHHRNSHRRWHRQRGPSQVPSAVGGVAVWRLRGSRAGSGGWGSTRSTLRSRAIASIGYLAGHADLAAVPRVGRERAAHGRSAATICPRNRVSALY